MTGIYASNAGTTIKHSLLAAIVALLVAGPARAAIIISEVDPSGSSATSNTYNADWFELTNTGAAAVNITGWEIDDNSNLFANAVPLRGVTSIAPGKSVVFIEGIADGSTDATLEASFKSFWFDGNIPAGFTIGAYGGSGVGLSQTADAVNIFDSTGARVTGVAFGLATVGVSFDNTAGAGSTTLPLPTISTLSAVGVNGAFASFAAAAGQPNEIGSPGIFVPEPSTVALAVLGLVCTSFYGWRRRRPS